MTRETPDREPMFKKTSIDTILPPELLISVFRVIYLDAIASIPYPPRSQRPPLDRHPLVEVMCVCRIWYRFVEETRSFWTFVVIRTSPGGHQLGMTASTEDKSGIVELERTLARSGTLPFAVNVASGRLADLRLVECLYREAYRLSTLNIIATYDNPHIWSSHVDHLSERSFPTLKRLTVGDVSTRRTNFPGSFQILVHAPELQSLYCHYHVVFPFYPLRLTSLSLTGIDVHSFEALLSSDSFHLPQLIDLHLDFSDTALFLSRFSTPSLQKLAVIERMPLIFGPRPLSQYPQLEELQWSEAMFTGPTLATLLPQCPNVIRFANYLSMKESNIDFRLITTLPTVIGLLETNGAIAEARQEILPKLEEVRLAIASCQEVEALVKGIPSIKRVRIMKIQSENEEEEDRQKIARLLEKVEVIVKTDPWSNSEDTWFNNTVGIE
ncbi:hypothetical protein FRC01_007136 [Tulasnella sp. 417]|nr:hypothetical protein FRC01_007136 [Tulasnella sp. 417]